DNSINHSPRSLIKKLWGYGRWSYFSLFIEYVINNFPILYLKSSMGAFTEVGYFSKAKGLAEYPRRPAVPLSGLLFSFNASSGQGQANNRTEITCRVSLWSVTLLYFILGIFIRPIISFLYGDEFLPAAEIFYYLYPGVIFYMQGLFLSSALAARGYNKETFTVRLKSLPVILIAAYFFITNFGTIGAALTVSFSATVLWLQYAMKYIKISNSTFNKILIPKKQDIQLFKLAFHKIFK
ncbi:MAG: hypothetical protein WD607_00965, partial [Candidatus Paceibacterota bacterium]